MEAGKIDSGDAAKKGSILVPVEEFLLTISHSGSFFGNEVNDYMIDIGPPDTRDETEPKVQTEEDEDDIRPGKKLSYFESLAILKTRKVFVFSMIALSSLFFVVTGIQFWISDYMRSVLLLPAKEVFITFAVISITAPVLGVVAGGIVLDRIGGYTGNSAITFAMGGAALSAVFGLPVPYFS
mmetsp:Transcript_39041/g.34720  ORF Transcript_39041/g.34720 Transcript_39041/m.34720 type:complete len:182 (-) Transcript_39041:670-1215(-)|eukprot:CAMPEP_0114590796 /NCGR_PEP_ID=MMETSP0125-20121206/12983_1 /TAXON_ID=485358 ORGANISM="Aristerostoma sp., Strain ATCC 50986" /NCGR_SAMPLE_ID=MMETSP0125 /ASSEMBLY_ACC=CAM_ASM_000245 /LENGTH=181 /DNA_ID=CAMNT_0001788519 /DNA_START=632 /DNA_END=1177 /DNA_ORIENTATION=-